MGYNVKQEIIDNNYIRVPEFISRKEAADLATEFKQYAIPNCTGDEQATNSHAEYCFLPFVRLLVKKVPEVSLFFVEEVLPTYVYSRIYKNGSILERHRDRAACEVSLTINLSKTHDWPIFFQRPDKSETSIELSPGDAVLYMGCSADHWREQFTGEEYTQVFMHYVKAYGDNSWAYFDKSKQNASECMLRQISSNLEIYKLQNKNWEINIL